MTKELYESHNLVMRRMRGKVPGWWFSETLSQTKQHGSKCNKHYAGIGCK